VGCRPLGIETRLLGSPKFNGSLISPLRLCTGTHENPLVISENVFTEFLVISDSSRASPGFVLGLSSDQGGLKLYLLILLKAVKVLRGVMRVGAVSLRPLKLRIRGWFTLLMMMLMLSTLRA